MDKMYLRFVKYFFRNPILTTKYIFYRKILKRDKFRYRGILIDYGIFWGFVNNFFSLKDIKKISEDEIIINIKNLGKFYVKNSIPVSDITDYNILNVKDKVVLDIGAYVGDSSIYFIRRGAKKVYTYEAVKDIYNTLVKNIELNNLQDKIIPINKGIDCNKGENYININYSATGLEVGNEKIETIPIKDAFEEIYNKEGEFVAKIDCEGCEYSLLCLPDNILKYSKEYVIEIHGSPQLLISKFLRNGYKVKRIDRDNKWY
ncbi:FkbM family methyltransferase [Nanobdella aerobiophila]|uniref:FkbM family methyltransferase n=1 Tax=Nanobdella aerobiophila TaxID=2586965 RepID=A0A915SCI8_9ARCH|nr:FkbM family methyltransferase [Nanobdella aerobiophila]BBL45433.1 FkbM family methyltransferase [Nanobdella aerobiophila]